MKPIRQQLAEQARAIEARWASEPNGGSTPRHEEITLHCRSSVDPRELERRMAVGRNARDTCGVPAGHLLFSTAYRGWHSAGGGRPIVATLAYRERSWAGFVNPNDGWNELLLHHFGKAPYQPADFDAMLDALESSDSGTSGGADEPSPESGSWRDRPSLL